KAACPLGEGTLGPSDESGGGSVGDVPLGRPKEAAFRAAGTSQQSRLEILPSPGRETAPSASSRPIQTKPTRRCRSSGGREPTLPSSTPLRSTRGRLRLRDIRRATSLAQSAPVVRARGWNRSHR